MKCEECSRGTASCSCNKCETVYCSACFERVIHAFKCGNATSHGLSNVVVVLDWIKHVLRAFEPASKTFLEKRVSREFITMMLL